MLSLYRDRKVTKTLPDVPSLLDALLFGEADDKEGNTCKIFNIMLSTNKYNKDNLCFLPWPEPRGYTAIHTSLTTTWGLPMALVLLNLSHMSIQGLFKASSSSKLQMTWSHWPPTLRTLVFLSFVLVSSFASDVLVPRSSVPGTAVAQSLTLRFTISRKQSVPSCSSVLPHRVSFFHSSTTGDCNAFTTFLYCYHGWEG